MLKRRLTADCALNEVDKALLGSFLRSGNLFRLKGRLSVGRRSIARLVSRLRKSIEAFGLPELLTADSFLRRIVTSCEFL